MDPSTARALVKQIADQHGHLGEEVLNQMSPGVRRQVEEALLKKDEMIGSSVITLAKNLYNSTARFVFELLQNADDNSYRIAKATSIDPFISFRVYNRRIVVECNEDGFTHENLVAICNVGKSSKTSAQGYIGEKGIGFKSVFMVAWKAHIQSCGFSFSFHSGMGMISPVWEETEEALPHALTRITLFLHETGSDEALDRQRETTLQQFRELKATFLLFMKNLRRIDVKIYDDSEMEVSSTTFSMQHQKEGQVELKQETVQDGEIQEHTQYYYTTKFTASNIPSSENRQYTESELLNKEYANPNIILAFPITHSSVPIIKSQDVYAFLPVRNMGLPFLIQADFVTDASRQDIVRSSARNIKLLPAIAQAFIETVKQFCTHPTLSYQWMRYLPNAQWQSQDRFWKRLVDDIRRQLQLTPTMWTRGQRKLRLVRDMRTLPSSMCDTHGKPLLPDLYPEQYLSSGYKPGDLWLLLNYGLQGMEKSGFIERLRQDLHNDAFSIMRCPNTDNDWHSRVAEFLISAVWPPFSLTAKTIKSLQLIPLMGGGWGHPLFIDRSPIYFTHMHGYPLPTDGMFELVEPRAEMNPLRKQLFGLLGVREASVKDVRRKIMFQDKRRNHSLQSSRSHLHLLYLTAHLDRLSATFYFPDDDPYSPQQLLARFNPGEPRFGAIDLRPSILHPYYMRDCPEKPEKESRTWRAWLSEVFNIHDVIPLTRKGYLSEECLYVANSCPEKFLPFLLKYWQLEGAKIAESPTLIKALLSLEVLCENGRMYPLAETYVRTAQVKYADEFLRDDEFFPWLKLDASLNEMAAFSEIGVLTKALGFGYPKSELMFYLTILRFVAAANESREVLDASRIFNLYARIETRNHESVIAKLYGEMIVSAFESQRLIYVPAYGSEDASWAFPRECLWEAPPYMQSSYPLKPRYDGIAKAKYIADFFQHTLAIGNAGVDDFLLDLEWMEGDTNFSQVYGLYQELDERRPGMDEVTVRKVRERFEEGMFIYHESDDEKTWYRPSECLWSTVTDIKGMITLNDVYEELADFFIKLLGVRTLTLQMVHDKLVEQGRRQSSIAEIKQTIWLLNSYMQGESERDIPDPRKVLEAKVFPVRYPTGVVELCNCAADFAIADRKHLSDWFSGKAKFLDFDLNEIARLEQFLQWVGLDRRYLSSSVKEISMLHGDSYRSLSSPDRNISQKAHGLLRIAVHFRSPRIKIGEQHFYELLKKINVRETDGISSELHLNQDGKDIKVEVSQSELHFQESESGLTIHVPRDEETQYLCFLDRVPRALMEWIMTEPSTGICEPFNEKALSVLSKVLQAKMKYITLTLDRSGIMSVETPDDSAADEVAVTIERGVTERHNEGRDYIDDGISAREVIRSARTDLSVTLDDYEFITSPYAGPSTPSWLLSRTPFTPRGTASAANPVSPDRELPGQSVDIAYLSILRTVVTVARSSIFPSRGSSSTAAITQSPDTINGSFQLRGLEKTYRDKLIGAAGELFVFETLSHLNPPLPHFSRSNWQSTIRKHVDLHDDYSDLEAWNGHETADITYTDSEHILTSLLIDKGYLDDTWAGARPQYYLEVKATTSSWETPFYMSKYQYERVRCCSSPLCLFINQEWKRTT
ncbi:hypothetical protein BJX76DRAFT_348158 [Aspergillus varians]